MIGGGQAIFRRSRRGDQMWLNIMHSRHISHFILVTKSVLCFPER